MFVVEVFDVVLRGVAIVDVFEVVLLVVVVEVLVVLF